MGVSPKAGSRRKKRRPTFTTWSKAFLAHLAETSNVTASAAVAKVRTGTAYEAKRKLPQFNREWRQALCEGYELLELELLHRLRSGQAKGEVTKVGAKSHDNAIAFRLLIAHRTEAAKQRAVRDNQDGDAILAGIDAKLEQMRQRQLAADAAKSSDDGER